MILDKIFGKHVKWQNSYDYFNFIPYLKDEQKATISPRLFNTFSGFRWPYTKKVYPLDADGLPIPPESIRLWVNHVKNTLCMAGQSKINLGHMILQWYAHIFQCPTIKPWALVFKSEEGIGKGLWQTFFEQVLTKALSTVFSSWEQICGSFNGQMAGRLLFTLNEATNFPTNTQKELMKTMIKDTALSVNKKFVNQYDVDNYARIQITTNNKRPVAIDHDDRRYCCVEADNSVRGNAEYFKPLIDTRDNPRVQKDMFDFLTNYPLEGFNSEAPPMTKWKQDLIGQNLGSEMEFMKAVCAGEVMGCEFEEETLKIKSGMLYDRYKQWATDNGEHKVGSDRAFNAELKKNGIIKKTIKIGGASSMGFKLDKAEINTMLAKLLGNPELEL